MQSDNFQHVKNYSRASSQRDCSGTRLQFQNSKAGTAAAHAAQPTCTSLFFCKMPFLACVFSSLYVDLFCLSQFHI